MKKLFMLALSGIFLVNVSSFALIMTKSITVVEPGKVLKIVGIKNIAPQSQIGQSAISEAKEQLKGFCGSKITAACAKKYLSTHPEAVNKIRAKIGLPPMMSSGKK